MVKIIHTLYPKQPNLEFTFDDAEPIAQIALPSGSELPPFVYYYLRIKQEDGHIAWSSPIWIDLHDIQLMAPKKVKKK